MLGIKDSWGASGNWYHRPKKFEGWPEHQSNLGQIDRFKGEHKYWNFCFKRSRGGKELQKLGKRVVNNILWQHCTGREMGAFAWLMPLYQVEDFSDVDIFDWRYLWLPRFDWKLHDAHSIADIGYTKCLFADISPQCYKSFIVRIDIALCYFYMRFDVYIYMCLIEWRLGCS